MSRHRSHFRNVRFFDEANPDVVLGGLVQNGSITERNFLTMLGIVLVTTAPIHVSAKDTGRVILAVDTCLDVGDYLVSCEDEIHVSDEPWVHRVISYNVSGQEDAFRNCVRARDGKCVITGVANQLAPYFWAGFEAAHIFPLDSENLWIEWDYGGWITDMDDTVGISRINSCQNGFMLQATIHQHFDQHLLSVNPDDNYKIVVFTKDVFGVDGRALDTVCRDPADPHRVSDQLLRWHFRQSVLANMRGAGEPVFEHDFPPGTDMVKEIREGPLAQERLELELSYRLRQVV
ncbi:HNH endonuclease-domain-containing protein [Trichophaea hybrida]|nr:HNH endonuclease-domain-containing protein [Trichophaea hybrida]